MPSILRRLIFIFTLFEYIPLRLVRRWLVPKKFLIHYGRFLPYFINNAETDYHVHFVQELEHHLGLHSIAGKSFLELGSGRVNSVGYELSAKGAKTIYCLEPFQELNLIHDQEWLSTISRTYGIDSNNLLEKVKRIESLNNIPDESIDVIVSTSVLEHVQDLELLVQQLWRCLGKGGTMIHVIDLRDHFFKYPYHFLCFSKNLWDKFLNPGDLPRYRLSTLINSFTRAGFSVTLLWEKSELNKYQKIKSFISDDWDQSDTTFPVSQANIMVRKKN